jgi:hypothetical protein
VLRPASPLRRFYYRCVHHGTTPTWSLSQSIMEAGISWRVHSVHNRQHAILISQSSNSPPSAPPFSVDWLRLKVFFRFGYPKKMIRKKSKLSVERGGISRSKCQLPWHRAPTPTGINFQPDIGRSNGRTCALLEEGKPLVLDSLFLCSYIGSNYH